MELTASLHLVSTAYNEHQLPLRIQNRKMDHFRELRVLHHHRMNYAQECLIAGKQPSASGERVTLEHALTSVLGQDLDDPTTFPA